MNIVPEVAAYYFPNYHVDPRNEVEHGPGWTEWELMRQARPRFPNHRQPVVPEWGYEDEADPRVMARKIDCAAAHGIDAFFFDWYHYEDGPFLGRALEEGFLRAPNRDKLKFALMWANHTWVDIHPAKSGADPGGSARVLYRGEVSAKGFQDIVKRCLDKYFHQPNYWKIGGCPYFSIYDLSRFLAGLGGIEGAKKAIEEFREEVVRAGFPGLHLNAVLWDYSIVPGEEAVADPKQLLPMLGVDSFSSYVWIHHAVPDVFPVTPYVKVQEEYFNYWERICREVLLPYLPNVTMGWDTSPRTVSSDKFRPVGYPFMATLGDNTPENFKTALVRAMRKLQSMPDSAHANILTINAWNEWTEGSYLEPDTHHGLRYLEAIREAKEALQQVPG